MLDKILDTLKERRSLYILAAFFLILLFTAYSNHYNNGFRFDDTHTIVHNEYIKDLSYLPLYFSDIKTFGTMPNNRGYRPLVTTMNAIDFWRGRDNSPGNEKGKLEPKNFHTSIMFWYVVQLFLMFFFFRTLMKAALPSEWNDLIALLATSFYALHTANAETINYIIARSDSFSTLCIVASFVVYLTDKGKKYFLYLIPMILAMMTKEVGIMFVPLLFFYILLFEQNVNLSEFFLFKKDKRKAIFNSIKQVVVPFLVGIFVLVQSTSSAGSPGGKLVSKTLERRMDYFFSQANVIKHYLSNFVLPLELSADPDHPYIRTLFDSRVIFGLLILVALLIIAIRTSKNRRTLPISFGIIWFYVALAPTSSIHPLGQISNDHRTFFPYIGLVLALTWWIYLVIIKYREKILSKMYYPGLIALSILLLFGAHAYGIHQRNIVWSSEDKLWHDVSIKSPNNGRGLMNYGLTLMAKGDYKGAKKYFLRALELLPHYSYLHINLGILENAMGDAAIAEEYFKKAMIYDPSNAEGLRFYARFLLEHNRKEEAIQKVQQGLAISPGHSGLLNMQKRLNIPEITNEERLANRLKAIETDPSINNYINLGVLYYKMKQYANSIKACEEVLKIDPENALAFNNMCIAYNQLGQKEKAIEACKKALQIQPDFQLAKNNLKLAESTE